MGRVFTFDVLTIRMTILTEPEAVKDVRVLLARCVGGGGGGGCWLLGALAHSRPPPPKKHPTHPHTQTKKPKALLVKQLPKSPTYSTLRYLIGAKSMLTQGDTAWARSRKAFTPAFSPAFLKTLVPLFISRAQIMAE